MNIIHSTFQPLVRDSNLQTYRQAGGHSKSHFNVFKGDEHLKVSQNFVIGFLTSTTLSCDYMYEIENGGYITVIAEWRLSEQRNKCQDEEYVRSILNAKLILKHTARRNVWFCTEGFGSK
jgi:hypothetical protein